MTGFTTHNPATGQPLQTWPWWTSTDIESGLQQAAFAQSQWRDQSMSDRAQVLLAIAAALEADPGPLAAAMTAEMGKPLQEARAEVRKSAWVCRHYAEHGAAMLAPQAVVAAAPINELHFAPLGVILSIMPWNFPVWQVLRFAAPAWMAGNAVVMKHAPNTFGTATELARVCAVAGLPDGLLINARIPVADIPSVIADRRIAAVTVTGSDRAGRAVAAAAGSALKKCVLELGGSDPFIVLEDADLTAAVDAAVASRTLNSGQSCIAAKRFFVADAVYAAFVDQLAARMQALVVGDPTAESTQVGPLARPDLQALLARQVDESCAAGARAVCGGAAPTGGGSFYPPTVLVDVPDDCPAATEELFGPVAAVWSVGSAAEAVARANASRFGLSASVWTADRAVARQIAGQLQTGGVFVNQFSYSDPRLPFGGVKDSGYGRELGVFGIREFVNVQTLSIR